MASDGDRLVWRWNDFDPLEEVMVGIADGACFPPLEPGCQSEFNDQYTKYGCKMSHPISEQVPWPTGPKLKRFIDGANEELNGMVELLEGEGCFVKRPDPGLCSFNVRTRTPDWESPNQYCVTCPRDVVMTIGNEIVEATMSKRSRFFEYRPFRPLIKHYFDKDPRCVWTAAPKPMMGDSSYTTEFWDWDIEERKRRMHEYTFCINENEIMFDAADCLLIGDMMFVQQSMVTNLAGIRWLKRHFEPKGIQVQTLHFPYDLFPSHTDCTFVAVRPGLVLTNPERPFVEEEVKIFKQNDWKMVDIPFFTETKEHPICCQSSRWLSMNVFSITQDKIVVEEGETPLINFLEQEHGFDVLGLPYRKVFEFGGSLHCSTWDIRRRGEKKNYFPNREGITDVGMEKLTNLP
jgi:glycine amidinotransferase